MSKRPIKNLRWYIAVLLCLASALNYLDRQTLAVLIGTIKEDLHITNADYGTIMTWFLISYGIMYAVSGRVIDIVGTRRGFAIFVSGWSIGDMLFMFARSVFQFCGCNFLLGVFEPGNFTGGMRAVSEWFPMRERALAVGIFNSGVAFGVSRDRRAGACLGGRLVADLQAAQGSSASQRGGAPVDPRRPERAR